MKKIVLPNSLQVLIRPQMLEDANELWQFYSSLSRETRILVGKPEEANEQEYDKRMIEAVKSKNLRRFVCIVQSPQEKIVGYFGIDFPQDPKVGWLFLVVQEAYQGRGLGKEIMRYIIEEAFSLGLEALKCQVDPENKPAIKLYTGFNFKVEKEWTDHKTKKLAYRMHRTISQ